MVFSLLYSLPQEERKGVAVERNLFVFIYWNKASLLLEKQDYGEDTEENSASHRWAFS